MDKIRQIIEEFLKQNEAERRLSLSFPPRISPGFGGVFELSGHLQGVEDIGQLDLPLLRGFLAQLHKKNKKSTVARKMAALRSCFGYAQKKGWILENPIAQVRTPKIEKTIPPFLSEKEVEACCKSRSPIPCWNFGTRLFLELFYASGLRLSELTHLNWNSLDLSLGLLRVLGKGGKERIVPVGRKALGSLVNYPQALKQAEQRSEFKINRSSGRVFEPVRGKGQRSDYSPQVEKTGCRGKFVSDDQSPFPASQLCHALIECRGRPAGRSGNVGAYLPVHNPEIYSCQHESFA